VPKNREVEAKAWQKCSISPLGVIHFLKVRPIDLGLQSISDHDPKLSTEPGAYRKHVVGSRRHGRVVLGLQGQLKIAEN